MSYTNAEFELAYEEILKRILFDKIPVQNPIAYILGGQPGAGKTQLQKIILRKNKNVIAINADAYRQSHPRFESIQDEFGDDSPKYTQPFINEIVERLISDLSDMKYNLIIEGTLRTADVPLNTCHLLKNKNYKVELYLISVKKDISYESTILRYENNIRFGMIPRATAKEHHDKVVDAICDNLDIIFKENIFDDIKLYDREGNNLYSIKDGISPVLVEKDKLFGAWSEDEISSYKEIINTVIFLKQARKAPDLAQYILESSKRLSNAQSNSKTASRKFPLSRNQIKKNAKIISHTQENQSQHNKDKSKSR